MTATPSTQHTTWSTYESQDIAHVGIHTGEDGISIHVYGPQRHKRARRIVACINRLAPFTTEEIENGIDLVALKNRIQSLEAALKGLLAQCEQGAAYHGITIDSPSAQAAVSEARKVLGHQEASCE